MKKYISVLFALFLVFSIHAQSADVITDILNTEEVTFGQVCYISAVEQGLISEKASYDEAVVALVKNEQLPESLNSDIVVPAIDAAFIMSYIWDIKGGIMFKITRGSPRYCFKQFKADGIISSSVEPKDSITGADLLEIYNRCTRIYGGFDITSVSMEIE